MEQTEAEVTTTKYEVAPELKAQREAQKLLAWQPDFSSFKLGVEHIAYEDDYMLIIDKPAGMLVHPTTVESGTTLYDYVQQYYMEKGITADIHPVMRLDRNTSGLVIFAKEPIVQFWLSQQNVHKEYLALCNGVFPAEEGVVEAPIARDLSSIITRCVDFERGKYAKTAYKVIGKYGAKSLVKLQLFTGRTHQIRVHMAHIGCPLVNDNLYGTPGPQARHALHAYRLAFKHPVGDYPIEITRALPQDLQSLLKA